MEFTPSAWKRMRTRVNMRLPQPFTWQEKIINTAISSQRNLLPSSVVLKCRCLSVVAILGTILTPTTITNTAATMVRKLAVHIGLVKIRRMSNFGIWTIGPRLSCTDLSRNTLKPASPLSTKNLTVTEVIHTTSRCKFWFRTSTSLLSKKTFSSKKSPPSSCQSNQRSYTMINQISRDSLPLPKTWERSKKVSVDAPALIWLKEVMARALTSSRFSMKIIWRLPQSSENNEKYT